MGKKKKNGIPRELFPSLRVELETGVAIHYLLFARAILLPTHQRSMATPNIHTHIDGSPTRNKYLIFMISMCIMIF